MRQSFYTVQQLFSYVFKLLLLIAFIFISYQIVMSATGMLQRILYLIIAIIVIAFNVLYEVLKHWYTKLQIALTITCDVDEVARWRDKIVAADRVKGMKHSLVLSDILGSLDQNNPDKTLTLIEEHADFLSSKLDYLYIKHYATMKAYALTKNRTQVNRAYQELEKYRAVSQRKHNKQLSPLFDWNQIDGLYYTTNKDYKKALKAYRECNVEKMNPRELVHYHAELSSVYQALNKHEAANKQILEIQRLAPKSPFSLKEVL